MFSFSFLFCLQATFRKDTWMRAISATVAEAALKIITRGIKWDPALQRTLHQNRWYLTLVIHFFSSSENYFLNLTQCLLTYWILFDTVNLYIYLWIFTFILRNLKFIQCLYASCIKISNFFMRISVPYKISSWKSYVLFSMRRSYPLT